MVNLENMELESLLSYVQIKNILYSFEICRISFIAQIIN